ncbi:MAG: chemotaxis protein CheW [Deltaproteobacteria bacterium]|nr:chemotaxis protein CheW [Deltaproteobacteria bacterium]
MDDSDELVKEFVTECNDYLDQLDRDILALERSPSDQEVRDSVFRAIHTIKGNCGYLGLSKLEAVAHAGESLLSRVREGEIAVTSDVVSVMLRVIDAVRVVVGHVEANGSEGEEDHAPLIRLISDLQKTGRIAAEQHAAVPTEDVAPRGPESTIRVDVDLLDKLMSLVGELVLSRNQILQFATTPDGAALAAVSQHLNLITSELQERVMKTRMQPIATVWSKFPRLVRDLTNELGKLVRIEMEGRETELDKTIIEAIKDPLTHLVRNAVDHGLEEPATRVGAGKAAEGRLLLRAYHEGGQVIIEIADDGGGIDIEGVKKRSIERGLLTPQQAVRLGDREVAELIFTPGFSTAAKVTSVSGRGVGMDVVKTHISKIGGTIDIQTTRGAGTTFRVKIPLTLAIIPALIVSSAKQRFAIPQVNLVELVLLEGEAAVRGLETVHGAPVYRLRGDLLPLVFLNAEFGDEQPDWRPAPGAPVNIIVLQADDQLFGLVVDEINDTQEIVVKPLQKRLKDIPLYAGATVMGDGRVQLILDVLGIAHRAHVLGRIHDTGSETKDGASDADGDLAALLLVQTEDNGRGAIPLSLVARLEEFPRSAIELVGGRKVVQYRQEILPLIDLRDALPERRLEPRSVAETNGGEVARVVVYSELGRSMGIIVPNIIDIVEERLEILSDTTRAGVSGCAVIQERVTELLDVQGMIRAADPSFFDRKRDAATAQG